jgi:glycosyltransferase involved in cell wall biosynthesis
MKISVIGPTYPFRGGISHYTTLLVKTLRQKYNLQFLSFKRQYPGFLYPGRSQIDRSRKVLRTDSKPVFDPFDPFSWLVMVGKIKQFKPHLLVINWVTSFFALQFGLIIYFIKKLTNAKILIICHNVKQHESTPGEHILCKMVFKNTDYFIVHSSEDESNLKKLVPQGVIKKTYHPTYNFFAFNRLENKVAKEKLGILGNLILYFGFVREYKGLKYLIDALPIVLKNVDTHLLIVGEFWEDKEKYLEQIQNLGVSKNVTIIDRYVPNEEVGLYFSACDMVVLPYISATQSGIIQIAYGFTKPVITTNVGGLPEVVENEKTGFIVPPRDSKALAEAIISFYKERREKDFANSIVEEKEKFSWDRMCKVIESFCSCDC